MVPAGRGVLCAVLWSAGVALHAQTAPARAPLTGAEPPVRVGETAATLAAAQRAQQLGLVTAAIGLYQQLLAAPGADRAGLTLPLATALLDAGRGAEAERLLQALPSPRGPEWRLRLGLAAAQQKKFDLAREQVDRINVDDLTRPDRAWFWFLQGVLADTGTPRDVPKANDYYKLAQNEAPSDLARATFLIAGERVRLGSITYTPAEIEDARKRYEARQDSSLSYRSAEDYAVMRDATGGKNDAVRFLSELIIRLPRGEREWADRFRLLLGLIGDRSRGGAGRNALNQLLEDVAAPAPGAAEIPDLQREALQILADASQQEPERTLFSAEVEKLIGSSAKSPIYDALLLLRAQLALTDTPKDYATAERRANELKERFPGSPLRPHAFAVLATAAWEQQRYRVAADNARQAREALAASPAARSPREARVTAEAVAQLRVFEAEARFRAQDYRLAADAYAAVLRDPPPGIDAGALIFQQALAEIRAPADESHKDLTAIVDRLEADPRFDPANRWEAEWSLARALKVQGRIQPALDRVTRLLAAPDAAGITPELRARMTWLQARLSFDANQPELTLRLVPAVEAAAAKLTDVALRTEISSTTALLKADAEFQLDREAAALDTLAKLRAEFPKTDAAVYSYIDAADYYAQPGRDKIQDAQKALRSLIDNPDYKQSVRVPYALFKLAQLSERLGQDKDLRDADHLIEELVAKNRVPPAPADLVFEARLEQGDILRNLNDFPAAQVAYEALVNSPLYAQRPDLVVAQLRLAECHNAQSALDPSGSQADQAQSIFEELLYRLDAPDDVRVEAGYNLGELLLRRGQPDKARDVWWRDVITQLWLNAAQPIPAGATRPYWLARTLSRLGELFEQRGAFDDARRVYVLLRDGKLGYEAWAAEGLKRLGVAAAKS